MKHLPNHCITNQKICIIYATKGIEVFVYLNLDTYVVEFIRNELLSKMNAFEVKCIQISNTNVDISNSCTFRDCPADRTSRHYEYCVGKIQE